MSGTVDVGGSLLSMQGVDDSGDPQGGIPHDDENFLLLVLM